jgi:cytidine deaminase
VHLTLTPSTMQPFSHMGGVGGMKKVAYAINGAKPKKGGSSIHAEEAVLIKASSNPKINKRKTYDILVLRFSSMGILGSSRPCMHCILRMMMSDVKIHTVYYSTDTGEICAEKLSSMLSTGITYISTGNRSRAWTKDKKCSIIRPSSATESITIKLDKVKSGKTPKSGKRSMSPATI